jgi:hypothetical protein
MLVFISLFFLIVILGAVNELQNRRALSICILMLVLVGGLRFETGYDWMAYELAFAEIDVSKSFFDSLGVGAFEPLYLLLCYVVKLLGGGVAIVFFVSAASLGLALYTLFRRFDVDYWIPLVMYVGFCYLIAFFIVVRFSLAAALVIFALGELLDGRRGRALFYVVLGAGFHVFALAFLPLMLLVKVRLKVAGIALCVALAFVVTKFIDLGVLLALFALAEGGGFLAKFSFYAAGLETSIPTTVYLFLFFNVAMAAIVSRYLQGEADRALANTAAWLSMMVVAGIVVFYPVPSVWNRFMLVAVPIQGVALAKVLLSSPRLRRLSASLVVSALSLVVYSYSLFQEGSFFYPYESQFDAWLGTSSGIGRERMEREFQ